MLTRRLPLCSLLVYVLLAATPTVTDASSIAYINSTGGSVNYLAAYGHTLTYINDPVGLTLGDLAGFDAILIASNAGFTEPGNIGNVAAAFANAGGGVVLTEFDFQGMWALGGAIMTTGYSPFTIDPLSSGYAISSNLGVVLDPSSPLFAGVNPANVNTLWQANVLLDPGATLVASWTSGRLAIAYRSLAASTVVALNLFPGQPGLGSERLVANALQFSTQSQSTAVPEPGTLGLLAAGAFMLYRRQRSRI